MISDRCSTVPLDIVFSIDCNDVNICPLLLLHTNNTLQVLLVASILYNMSTLYYKSISKDVLSWGGWSVAVALTSGYQLYLSKLEQIRYTHMMCIKRNYNMHNLIKRASGVWSLWNNIIQLHISCYWMRTTSLGSIDHEVLALLIWTNWYIG